MNFERYNIPEHMRGPIERYIQYGIAGDFLTALFSNDLMRTFERADDINRHHIRDFLMLMYNEFPGDAWGSPERVKQWQEKRRPKIESGTTEGA